VRLPGFRVREGRKKIFRLPERRIDQMVLKALGGDWAPKKKVAQRFKRAREEAGSLRALERVWAV